MAITKITSSVVAINAISGTLIADNAITAVHIAQNAVTQTQIAAGALSDALAADSVTGAKIADDAIDSEHYTDGSIDTAHLAADAVTAAKLADDAVVTANIVDLNVTTAKIANNAITAAKLPDNVITATMIPNDLIDSDHFAAASIDNEHLADDAVGVAELSATGTASSSTFLRGDNSWTAVSGTTINSNTNNYVITGTGTANTLQGEANLLYDGTTLEVFGTGTGSYLKLHSNTNAGAMGIAIDATKTSDGELGYVGFFNAGDSVGAVRVYRTGANDAGDLTLATQTTGGSLTDRVRIDSTGKFGIGVTPTHAFNLQGTGSVEARFRSTDGDMSLQISSDADEGQDSTLSFVAGTGDKGKIVYDHHTTAASQKMNFITGDAAVTAMTITGDGKVLIGNTAANDGEQFKVEKNGACTATIYAAENSSARDATLRLQTRNTGAQCRILFMDGSGAGTTAGEIEYNHDGNNMLFGVNGSNTALVLDGSQNVHVTTSDSVFNFHGSNGSGNLVVGNGSGAQGMTIFSGDNSEGRISFADGTGSGYLNADIRYDHDDDLMIFGIRSGGNAAERMRLGATTLEFGMGNFADPVFTIKSAAGGDPVLRFDTGAVNRGGAIQWFDQGTNSGAIEYAHNGNYMKFRAGSPTTVTFSVNDGSIYLGARTGYSSSTTLDAHGNFVGEVGGNMKAVSFFREDGGTSSGYVVTLSNSTVGYYSGSDYRLKENVNYDWDAITRLKQLKPARFNWIEDETNTGVDGFIAHEVSSIVPEAVHGEKDAMTDPILYEASHEIPAGKSVGDVKTPSRVDSQTVDPGKLVPLLVKAVQELEARIATLEG